MPHIRLRLEMLLDICKGKMTQEGRVELCLLIFKAFFEKPILNRLMKVQTKGVLNRLIVLKQVFIKTIAE